MKVERAKPSPGARAIGYTRKADPVSAGPVLESVPAGSTTDILGIPESEFTPRVRDAIMMLMAEVDSLRRELQQTRVRLEDAEKVADQDDLLPVLNRRAFVRELTRHIAMAARYGTPASLVYFDLDGFKAVNDTHHHAGGDAVLAHFVSVLNDNVRDTDVIGRLGGDEFGVILTHVSQEQASRKVENLAVLLRRSPALWQGQKIPVSFSYGALELKAGENADVAMARADEAMYTQKRAR
jgi:diguanylate cyclase (GGDEF)-like protein